MGTVFNNCTVRHVNWEQWDYGTWSCRLKFYEAQWAAWAPCRDQCNRRRFENWSVFLSFISKIITSPIFGRSRGTRIFCLDFTKWTQCIRDKRSLSAQNDKFCLKVLALGWHNCAKDNACAACDRKRRIVVNKRQISNRAFGVLLWYCERDETTRSVTWSTFEETTVSTCTPIIVVHGHFLWLVNRRRFENWSVSLEFSLENSSHRFLSSH